MAKVRFGVVGCGHIGKRHAEMILRNEGASLVAMCDVLPLNELHLDLIQTEFFNQYAEFIQFLKKGSTDTAPVVCICTPNGLHASLAIEAIEAGCHVVIEKPMALSEKEATLIMDTANRCKRQVFCVMQNRYSPPSIWLKELVESGILGKLFLVQINCYWNRDERYYLPTSWHGNRELDGGTLFTQFSHFVDILYWLFGDINNINARFADFNHENLTDFEDSGLVTFDILKGGMGSLHYSTSVWDSNQESSLTIVAENGSVRVGGQYMNEVEYCHIKNYAMPRLAPTNPGNDYGAYKGSAQNHHFVIQNVIDVLIKGEEITTNALDGVKVVGMIERIYNQK
ncbi:MAG: Gfo/Idh/MocA family oxidoreductase [Bacteroidales bacterium]